MARDILNRANQNVGIDQRIWMTIENQYGILATTGLFPTSSNAIEHTQAKIDFTIPRETAAHRSGRSAVVRLQKKKSLKWSFESYIVPADPDGSNHPVLPDMHPMLLSAFGGVDTSDPTTILYHLERSVASSIRLLEEGTHFSQIATGCVADQISFTLPGDGKAMFKASGFGQDTFIAGHSEVLAPVAANAGPVTTITFSAQAGEGARYDVGGYVDVIDKNDGNTRKLASAQIASISGDAITCTLPAAYTGAAPALALGDIIIGAAPDYTPTSSVNALLGLRGTFDTDLFGMGVDLNLIQAEISIKNNFTEQNFNYGVDYTTNFIADKRREVSLKLDVLLTKDNWEFYSKSRRFVAENIVITLGPQNLPGQVVSGLGRTLTFTFPRVEFDVPNLEQPADGYIKLSLSGMALAQDINNPNNEMTLTIT